LRNLRQNPVHLTAGKGGIRRIQCIDTQTIPLSLTGLCDWPS
jgi:hypothetical protein